MKLRARLERQIEDALQILQWKLHLLWEKSGRNSRLWLQQPLHFIRECFNNSHHFENYFNANLFVFVTSLNRWCSNCTANRIRISLNYEFCKLQKFRKWSTPFKHTVGSWNRMNDSSIKKTTQQRKNIHVFDHLKLLVSRKSIGYCGIFLSRRNKNWTFLLFFLCCLLLDISHIDFCSNWFKSTTLWWARSLEWIFKYLSIIWEVKLVKEASYHT